MGTSEPVRLPEDDDALIALARPEGLPQGASGLFRPDSWLRRVSAEPVLLFGGGYALLLEIAHPMVAAGVAEHSDFRTNPFGRLRRTLDAMNAITFGDLGTALAAARSVERVHLRVRGAIARDAGRFRAGAPYSGRDPEAVRWVWATLVDTALKMYERFIEPLAPEDREAYYADQRVLGRILGVPVAMAPDSLGDFVRYMDEMLEGDELAVNETTLEIADAVLNPPAGLAGARLVRSIAAALLPERLRRDFGLSWDEFKATKLEALAQSVRALRPASRPKASAQ